MEHVIAHTQLYMAVLNNSERKLAAQCLLIVNNSGALYIPPTCRSVCLPAVEREAGVGE